MKENNDNQENFTLKKIRYYQGTIKDYETFWNEKIAQGESEESKETKACKIHNDKLNNAFKIIPVTQDNDTKPLTPDEIKKEEEKMKKSKKESKNGSEKETKDDDKKKKHKKEKEDE